MENGLSTGSHSWLQSLLCPARLLVLGRFANGWGCRRSVRRDLITVIVILTDKLDLPCHDSAVLMSFTLLHPGVG